jgi:hypothetical protein
MQAFPADKNQAVTLQCDHDPAQTYRNFFRTLHIEISKGSRLFQWQGQVHLKPNNPFF